jgi:hypothetical protein
LIAATRTGNAIRPAHFNQQGHTSVLGVVLFVNLSKAQHELTLHLFRAWCQVRYTRH